MLSDENLNIIRTLARQFGVKTVWLFGSALQQGDEARDIDLAVEGAAPDLFFRFYSRLFWELPKPVDLVDLDGEPPLESIIREKGVVIYER